MILLKKPVRGAPPTVNGWHLWFAWYPIQLSDTPGESKVYAWLERVYRQRIWSRDHSYKFKYWRAL